MRTASPYLVLALILGVGAVAWGVIGPALWAEGGSADPQVSEKEGTVSNVGEQAEKIDNPGEEEEKVADYVEVGPTTTLIQGLPYNPPIGWAFNPFPQANPWDYVDIHNKPPDAIQKEVVPPTSLNDTAGRVRIEGWFYNASVPDWPLRCEGNLSPPPGGQGTAAFHWSAKVAKRLIKKLVVWKDARPLHRTTLPEGPGAWQSYLRIAGDGPSMASANIKVEVETEPAEALGEALWRVKPADPANFAANPEWGSFSQGNPAECVLYSDKSRASCNNLDYVCGVGFDSNGNGYLDDAEIVLDIPIHYVPLAEYNHGLAQCTWYAIWGTALPAAHNSMCLFIGDWTEPYDFYDIETDTQYACDGTREEPQKYYSGHVHYRGLGVAPSGDAHFRMPFLTFGSDSVHADAIKNHPDIAYQVIWEKVKAQAALIHVYFAEHPEENSHVFSTDFFGTEPVKVTLDATLNSHYAYHNAGFWTLSLEVTVARYTEGLGVAGATLSGDLWDVYDWFSESDPANVQAGYQPSDPGAGNVFHEKVELRNDAYDDSHFPLPQYRIPE